VEERLGTGYFILIVEKADPVALEMKALATQNLDNLQKKSGFNT
jgi:hypothetical protein